MSSTLRYYRDRDGRVRVEFVGGVTPQRVIIAPDVDTAGTYLLDTVERTVVKLSRSTMAMFIGGGCYPRAGDYVIPLSMCRFVAFGGTPFEEASLGERSIEGIQTRGTRFGLVVSASTGRPSGAGESWVSPELQLVVYGRREDPNAGVVDYRLTKITRADPPAALFEVPTDFASHFLFRMGR